MKISAGDYYGWSEIPASKNNPDLDLKTWAHFLNDLPGLKLFNYPDYISKKQLGKIESEFVEMAMLDAYAKYQDEPAIDFLGLKGRKSVNGLFAILEKDPDTVKERARQSISEGLDAFVKVKLFGNVDKDLEII